jgi:hypothetical protein
VPAVTWARAVEHSAPSSARAFQPQTYDRRPACPSLPQAAVVTTAAIAVAGTLPDIRQRLSLDGYVPSVLAAGVAPGSMHLRYVLGSLHKVLDCMAHSHVQVRARCMYVLCLSAQPRPPRAMLNAPQQRAMLRLAVQRLPLSLPLAIPPPYIHAARPTPRAV